jgi:hypothetical protein
VFDRLDPPALSASLALHIVAAGLGILSLSAPDGRWPPADFDGLTADGAAPRQRHARELLVNVPMLTPKGCPEPAPHARELGPALDRVASLARQAGPGTPLCVRVDASGRISSAFPLGGGGRPAGRAAALQLTGAVLAPAGVSPGWHTYFPSWSGSPPVPPELPQISQGPAYIL